jgi:sugar lactone lactonase YvrE
VFVGDAANAMLARLLTIAATALAASGGGTGTIATFAGGYGVGSGLQIAQQPVALAASGTTLYVADSRYQAIRAIDTTTGRETVTATGFLSLNGLAVGPGGALYADDAHGLWRVDSSGKRSLVAKTAGPWFAVDGAGNVFVSGLSGVDTVGRIAPSGAVAQVAAGLGHSGALLVAPDGSLVVVDGIDGLVRKIDRSGTVSTVAGGGTGDGRSGAATSAKLQLARTAQGCTPMIGCTTYTIVDGSLALAGDGSLYIAEAADNRILRVDASGEVSVVADLTGAPGSLAAIAVVGQDLWIADGGTIERLTPDGHLEQMAGTASPGAGDGGRAVDAQLVPNSVAVGSDGTIFAASLGSLRTIDAAGTIGSVPLPGGFSADLVATRPGTVYVADTMRGRVFSIAASGATHAVGTFKGGLDAMAVDPRGDVYVVGGTPVALRRIDPSGRARVLLRSSAAPSRHEYDVGAHGPNFYNEGGEEGGLAVTPSGTVFLGLGHVIWRLDTQGHLTRFAGAHGPYRFGGFYGGFGGDGGPAIRALFQHLYGLAVDASGNLYVADGTNSRVRMISRNGRIETVAGDGRLGFSGDGGPATSARLELPESVALDGHGHLFIADPGGNVADLSGGRLRVVNVP